MINALEQLMAPQTAQARDRLVHGLVTAKVVRIQDDGTYLLDYLTMGDAEPSAPARVMMPMAGGRRGTYFFPEVGDEVVVAFELGDTNLPIILGAVWNKNDHPPDQAHQSPDNHHRTIVSRSGHELTFDDTPGAQKVTLKTQGGHEIVMDDAPAQGKVSVRTAGGRSVVLDDTPPGKVTVQSVMGVSVTLDDAGGRMSLVAPLQIELQSSMMISLQAPVVRITTTGNITASGLMIENIPFGLHRHLPPLPPPAPPAFTGPVAPS